MSLEQLIKKCKKRDRKAQEQLYNLFNNKLFSICLKYSRNKVEAEDNLQDSFVTIFNKIEQYKFKGSFEGWILCEDEAEAALQKGEEAIERFKADYLAFQIPATAGAIANERKDFSTAARNF